MRLRGGPFLSNREHPSLGGADFFNYLFPYEHSAPPAVPDRRENSTSEMSTTTQEEHPQFVPSPHFSPTPAARHVMQELSALTSVLDSKKAFVAEYARSATFVKVETMALSFNG